MIRYECPLCAAFTCGLRSGFKSIRTEGSLLQGMQPSPDSVVNELNHCYTESIECSRPWSQDLLDLMLRDTADPEQGHVSSSNLGQINSGKAEALGCCRCGTGRGVTDSPETPQGQLIPGLELSREF